MGLYALNTLMQHEDSNFTHWAVRDPTVGSSILFPSRQNDYIFFSEKLAAVSEAMAQNSSATDSDHRPIACSIPYPMTAEARALKKARAKNMFVRNPKTNQLVSFGPDV